MPVDEDLPPSLPVDLRQLTYFVTVANELSFTRAAKRLRISAPAVSQQVRSLERRVGVQLLVRDTRHVALTAAGRSFAESCQRLLEDAELAVLNARQVAGVVEGRIVVATVHDSESSFEPFLSDFHASHPHVQVEMSAHRHGELIAALRHGTIDVALTWSWLLERSVSSDALDSATVAEVTVVAAVPPESHLLRRRSVPRWPRPLAEPTVMLERDYSPVTFDYAVEQIYGPDCKSPPVHEVSVTVRPQETMARGVVEHNALTPLAQSLADTLRGPWKVRPFDPPWVMEGCAVWRPGRHSSAMLAFINSANSAAARQTERTDRKSPITES